MLMKMKKALPVATLLVFTLCFVAWAEGNETAKDEPAVQPAAPAQNITQSPEISDATDVIIKKIEVTGNFEVSDEEILKAITSKEGDKLSTTKLEDDLQRVFDLGYFSEDVKASLAEFESGAKITFRVKENRAIKDVKFDGNKGLQTKQLLEMIATKKNSVLNTNVLRKDVEAIEAKYHEAGFAAARVIDAPIDNEGNLHILISEGVIQAIKVAFVIKNKENPEEVETKDTGKTKDYVIIREMKTKAGDIYNTKTIGKDLQRIYNLGFFEDVHTRVDAGEKPGQIILIVEVEEAKTGQAGFGAGYSSNTGLTGFLTLSERNLKGKGRRADIKLEIGGKRDNYEFGYFEPWLDKKQTSIEFNFYNTSRENLTYGLAGEISPDYQEIRNGFDVTLGRPISDYTRVFAGFKIETVNVEPAKYDYLDGSSRSVTGSIRTDTRDFVFNPTTGRYDSMSLELNGGPLGGDYDYQKLTVDLRRYYPVRKKQVAAGRVTFGLARGTIARFDYFDLGGVNSLRGYDEYQFSGTKMLLYNFEYRFTMSGNLSTVVFADAGNCWMSTSDMKFLPDDNMHRSVGIGLRLKIPQFGIGPVRLDYAILGGESKIHFGFGHMF